MSSIFETLTLKSLKTKVERDLLVNTAVKVTGVEAYSSLVTTALWSSYAEIFIASLLDDHRISTPL